MQKKINTKILRWTMAFAIVMGLVASCKKYEEGPSFSFLSKKSRLANEWKMEMAFELSSGVETTQDYNNETWEFTKKGEYFERSNGNIEKAGTWDFISDKESIQLTFPGPKLDYLRIVKLKNNELWLQDNDEEYHLIPAQ